MQEPCIYLQSAYRLGEVKDDQGLLHKKRVFTCWFLLTRWFILALTLLLVGMRHG